MAVEVVRTIRAAGGDFTNVSSWMDSYAPNASFLNLTEPATPTRVYAFTGADQFLANEIVTSQTGATGTVRGTVKDGLIVIRAQFNAFSSGDVLTSASGSITLSSGGAAAILVCEFYGDWPNGLVDSIRLRIFGNAGAYPVFRVEDSARHKGRHRTTPGLFYLAPASGAGFVDLSFAKGYAELYDIAVAGQDDGFIVDSNKYMVNPLVYEAVNGVASFANIASRSVIINGQTTAVTPVGYQLVPGSGTQTYLLNCSDWNSLTSFSVSDIIGSTDANLINCAGLSDNAALACFIGGFTNAANTNNASYDDSAPGGSASFDARPVLEDEVLHFKHLSFNDTELKGRGSNLTNHALYPYALDYDYHPRATLGTWAIGPDEPLEDYRAIGYGELTETPDTLYGVGATWNVANGVLVDPPMDSMFGEGLVNESHGYLAAYAVAETDPQYPLGLPLHDEMFGDGVIVGDAQGILVDKGLDQVHGIGKVGVQGRGALVDEFDTTSFAGGDGRLVEMYFDQIAGTGTVTGEYQPGWVDAAGYNEIGFLGMMGFRGELASKAIPIVLRPIIPGHNLVLPAGSANNITDEHPHMVFTQEQADWLQRKLAEKAEEPTDG